MRAYFNELLRSRYFYCSVLFLFCCFISSTAFLLPDSTGVSVIQYIFTFDKQTTFEQAPQYVTVFSLLNIISSQMLTIAYPLIGGFTSVALLCDKKSFGYLRFVILRTGRLRLAIYEVLFSVVSSFLCTLISLSLYAIVISMSFPHGEGALKAFVTTGLAVFAMILIGNLMSLIVASFISNKYIALFVPMFLIYLFSNYINRATVSAAAIHGYGKETTRISILDPIYFMLQKKSFEAMPELMLIPIGYIVSLLILSFLAMLLRCKRSVR